MNPDKEETIKAPCSCNAHTHTCKHTHAPVPLAGCRPVCLTLSDVMLTVKVQKHTNMTMHVGDTLQKKTEKVRGGFVKVELPPDIQRQQRQYLSWMGVELHPAFNSSWQRGLAFLHFS